MDQTQIWAMYVLWPRPLSYDLESRSGQTLGSWTTKVWNIIHIQHCSKELWPKHRFRVCKHCDLDLWDMTLSQGHDKPLVMDNKGVKYYPDPTFSTDLGQDTDLGYVWTVTWTLEIWPWVKVMTNPLVMDNNTVKYYPDPTWQ